MSDLKAVSLFDTLIYQAEVPKYLEDKSFMAVCDEHTDKAIADAKQSIDNRHKRFNAHIKDHGMSYHSGPELYKDERLGDFELLVRNTGRNILTDQGFDISNYTLDYTEMWIQKFAYEGGGHQDTHVHWDNHISGFYFLKLSFDLYKNYSEKLARQHFRYSINYLFYIFAALMIDKIIQLSSLNNIY